MVSLRDLVRMGSKIDVIARHLDELDAAARVACPIFFIQAATDYSTRPTVELAAAARAAGVTVAEKVFQAWGLTHDEGHLFERNGPHVWGPDVRRFLERWL